jgi:hypothetical protein
MWSAGSDPTEREVKREWGWRKEQRKFRRPQGQWGEKIMKQEKMSEKKGRLECHIWEQVLEFVSSDARRTR